MTQTKTTVESLVDDLLQIEQDAVLDLAGKVDSLIESVPESTREQFRQEAIASVFDFKLALARTTGELVGRVKCQFGETGGEG